MSTQREWTTIREYDDILLIIIMELPVSRSTVSAIGMRLLRQLLLK